MAGFNINRVSAEDLHSKVKMLGKDRAEKIIKYRDEHGPFNSFDDLKKVPGITEGIIDSLKKANVDFGKKAA